MFSLRHVHSFATKMYEIGYMLYHVYSRIKAMKMLWKLVAPCEKQEDGIIAIISNHHHFNHDPYSTAYAMTRCEENILDLIEKVSGLRISEILHNVQPAGLITRASETSLNFE